jgi:hypothetical protein
MSRHNHHQVEKKKEPVAPKATEEVKATEVKSEDTVPLVENVEVKTEVAEQPSTETPPTGVSETPTPEAPEQPPADVTPPSDPIVDPKVDITPPGDSDPVADDAVSDTQDPSEVPVSKPRAVHAYGVLYSSVDSAAMALMISIEAVQARIAASNEEWQSFYYAEE